jgi:hypothetical protein
MSNTVYRYSKSLGMQSKELEEGKGFKDWHSSEEYALISFYKDEQSYIVDAIEKLQHALKENKKMYDKLKDEYCYLEKEFPEEFL